MHGALDSAAFANQLKQATASSYGMAGPTFAKFLIANPKLVQILPGMISKIKAVLGNGDKSGANGAVERVLGHFALIAAAGALATKAGITGWKPGDAPQALIELSREWIEAQDRSEHWQIKQAVDRTSAFLRAHGKSRFEKACSAPVVGRAGYRDEKWFFILSDAWNEIHAGHLPRDQAKHLISGRWMVRGDGKNLMSKTPGWVPGRPRAYKVRAEILNAGADASVATNIS